MFCGKSAGVTRRLIWWSEWEFDIVPQLLFMFVQKKPASSVRQTLKVGILLRPTLYSVNSLTAKNSIETHENSQSLRRQQLRSDRKRRRMEWQKHVFYDLCKCENGKAVEHWDIIQPIPTKNLANSNGMFEF